MITTTFLSMPSSSASALEHEHGAQAPQTWLESVDCPVACASMYAAVGARHYWEIYRIGWTRQHWLRYLQRPEIDVSFICRENHERIGYVELRVHPDASVEIVNFGLRPASIGRGLGRSALTAALRRGFALGSAGVWLHTCSLDHPSALKNYYARGFQFVREEVANFLPLDPVPEPDSAEMVVNLL